MHWDDLHWNPIATLSYNALLNFVVGMRGSGKTYGSLGYAIDKALESLGTEKPFQFLYVRRYKTELAKLTQARGGRLFNAVQEQFPTHDLKAESNTLYCDGEIIGYAQALTTASILKSDSMPNVQLIIFDEFIIDNRSTYHYLKDEVTKFLDLYETVARGRDVVVLFLSNAVSISNPYFMFFKLCFPVNGIRQRFGKAKDIMVENVVPPELSALKKDTRFGKLVEGTDFSKYAYDNEWLLDDSRFVMRKTKESTYSFTLHYMNTDMGIWYDNRQWLYFVSKSVDRDCKRYYSATLDDQSPNTLLMKRAKRQGLLGNLIEAYEAGAVRYDNVKIQNMFREIMRSIGV